MGIQKCSLMLPTFTGRAELTPTVKSPYKNQVIKNLLGYDFPLRLRLKTCFSLKLETGSYFIKFS